MLFWSLLAAIGASFFVYKPLVPGLAVSVSGGISTAAMMIGGPGLVVLSAIIGFTLKIHKANGKYTLSLSVFPYYKSMFNYAVITIIESSAAIIYWILFKLIEPQAVALHFIIILFAIVVKTFVNSVLMAKLFATITKQSFMEIWLKGFKEILLPFTIIGTLGIALGYGYLRYGELAVLMYFGPILLARFGFDQYMKVKQMMLELKGQRIEK